MNRNAPIGVFDSGLGGLTALRQLQKDLPNENFIYFGDTARVPYGGREKETLRHFAQTDIALLRSFGVKAILVACGTLSSVLLEEIKEEYDIPLVGVVKSAAFAAAEAGKKVAIWGTAASIGSGAYAKEVEKWGCAAVAAVPCPKLVPLIEGGHIAADDPDTKAAIAEYLAPVLAANADVLILGCTHYPLLEQTIKAQAPQGLTLVNSGKESVRALRETLAEQDLLRTAGEGHTRYLVSGDAAAFAKQGSLFMGEDLSGKVEHADAGK
ncbi:MAG: glutamate racemase [Clostridia bacterium]|nr:glutamate racemase [Clostridia bacterium]